MATKTCICNNPVLCGALVERFRAAGFPERGRYFRLPAEPKDASELKRGRRPDAQVAAERTIKERAVILKHLRVNFRGSTQHGSASMVLPEDARWSAIHLHPDVARLCVEDKGGRFHLPESVPATIAEAVSSEGFSYDQSDTYADGQFAVAPNYTTSAAISEVKRYERAEGATAMPSTPASSASSSSSATSSVSSSSSSEAGGDRKRARKSPAERKADSLTSAQVVAREEILEAEIQQLMRQLSAEREAHAASAAKLEELRELQSAGPRFDAFLMREGGLSRVTLQSDAWHRQHPTAATHLFGFKNWNETKLYVWALFLEKPPEHGGTNTESPMSAFEKCLITKMRIHRGYLLETLGLIWGRDESTISRYIDEWAGQWGEAGENLSILDVSEEYLDSTYPERYKEAGLLRVCALPDGKDFMIHTPRSNTVLSRASFSDKVSHSAVRCISWTTPTGLAFEHTDLFFARVTEKRLVELWGPRLQKCPRGWRMLADRGFAGTAHYYPNFNAQLTPKFLAGRAQFTSGEVKGDYEICKLRYTCEVAFSRVTLEASLQDVIPYGFFKTLDAMNHWGHANVNIHAPLCK